MEIDYTVAKGLIDKNIAIDWTIKDQNDEFWLDPIRLEDVQKKKDSYCSRIKNSLLSFHNFPSITSTAPKTNGMLRDAVWLPLRHRVIYSGLLHFLIQYTDHHLASTIYSYRKDTPPEDTSSYPFSNKFTRWKNFINDFRKQAIPESCQAILITDLANYYEHINIETLQSKIRSLVSTQSNKAIEQSIILLGQFLKLHSKNGYGIPQNYDPSSYFGSLYLYNVDKTMLDNRFIYSRYVDDIRICCQSKEQALRALHMLQRALQDEHLYLNSSKTKIIERNTADFDELVNVDDDITISKLEENLKTANHEKINESIKILNEKLKTHDEKDDRRFRAYLNRALEISDYEDYRSIVQPILSDLLNKKIQDRADRSDYWAKCLANFPSEDTSRIAFDVVANKRSIFDWQRYNAWRLLISEGHQLPGTPEHAQAVREQIQKISNELEKGLAIIYLGLISQTQNLPDIYNFYFSTSSSHFVQRCCILAIFKSEKQWREKTYGIIKDQTPEHTELIDYLLETETISIGFKRRDKKTLNDTQREVSALHQSGFGISNGRVVKFRMSYDGVEYE